MVTHKSGQPRKSLPKWAWVVGSLVLIVALIAAVSFWYQSTPKATDQSGNPAPTQETSGPAGAAPNGCLAGLGNKADRFLEGQRAAEHSEAGAVSVAAAIYRWVAWYPKHPVADVKQVVAAVLADGVTGKIADMEATQTSTQTYPGLTSEYLNFADGRYLVEESTPDMVRVTVAGKHFQNGKPLDLIRASTLTMVWEDDLWKVRSDGAESSVDEVMTSGASFAGGC